MKGRIFEVSPSGEIVWEYMNPYFGTFDPPPGGESAVRAHVVERFYRMPWWWGWLIIAMDVDE